ncbi:hypothetical protein EDB83DRAFT_2318382 [Lactarius deliciosus]|nr:hypothetical protein EDB83DRAFT_2318382 [Lactarius deliciosus]
MSHDLIEPNPSSSLYGVTWLQVYYYYNDHCSRDRWPLKFFVAFLMLVDTINLVFIIYEPYLVAITNFGDYESNAFKEVSCTVLLEVLMRHLGVNLSTFSCAYEATLTEKGLASTRIGSITSSGRGFSIPASGDPGTHWHPHPYEQSVVSLTTLGFGTAYSTHTTWAVPLRSSATSLLLLEWFITS